MEVTHGASSLGLPIDTYLEKLKQAGLSTMPGTAAEILDDDIRKNICPDKLTSQEWVDVIKTAHRAGIKTTSTIMFGHTEQPSDWSTHLIELREFKKKRVASLSSFRFHMSAWNLQCIKEGKRDQGQHSMKYC